MPFDNASGAPGLEWISEAFPELLAQRLSSPTIFVLTRDDRLRVYDRAGIPAEVHPTRATIYRLVEQMDVDYVILGRYTFDGRTFTASARVLDMQNRKLWPEATESGALTDLITVQTALAWDLLHALRPNLPLSQQAFLAGASPVRLDALENYVRGITVGTQAEKVRLFREATRLKPDYTRAWLELGRVLFNQHQYDSAISALAQIPESDPAAAEAQFYLGLSAYNVGDFSRSQAAFRFTAARLPLTEVDNNLGAATARLGEAKLAAESFQRATRQDPNDPDYHFNLGLALYRASDASGAIRELRQCIALRPQDAEAKSLLDVATGASRAPSRLPAVRLKLAYNEASFRELFFEIQGAAEERLAKTDPLTHAQFHVNHGRDLLAQGFVVEAEREFHEAITLAPSNPEAHAALANALEAASDFAGARNQAEAALHLKIFIDPLLLLARLDLRDNKADAAAQSVDRALQLDPANQSALTLKRAVAAKLAQKAQPLPN